MKSIGFIGLGTMGGPIARTLQRGEANLLVYDVNPDAMAQALAQGAEIAASPRDMADRAEVIFASLPSTSICREVAIGEAGVLHGAAIRCYIETSTIGRSLAQEMGAAFGGKGIDFLDAPVSGGPPLAREGTLTSIVAGLAPVLEARRGLIAQYSSTIFHVGAEPGAAQFAKLINNAIAIFGTLLTFEGLAIAERAGLDKTVLIDIINVSSGANFASRQIVPAAVLADEPAAVGRMAVFTKDIDLYLHEAEDLGVAPPVAQYLTALAHHACTDPALDVVPALQGYFGRILRAHDTGRALVQESDMA